MLLQIREFIAQEKTVSNQQVARTFHIDVHTLQPMLDIWLRQGVICRANEKKGCKRPCGSCHTPPEYYTYLL